MAYAWTEDLVTGNTTIDSQHKQLFAAINDLLNACSSGLGRTQLSSTLKFLMDYTAKHFGDEEKLQQQYKYPDYPNHKKLHDGYKATVASLAKQFEENGATAALITEANIKIGDWLVGHIKREDKKVAAHIRG